MANITVGKIENFETEYLPHFVKAIECLISFDDLILARQMCDMLPAYYRDNVPTAIEDLKTLIHKAKRTTSDYCSNPDDERVNLRVSIGRVEQWSRAKMVHAEIVRFNADGKIPHLVDLGPGNMWMAQGMHSLGASFTYKPIGVTDCDKIMRLASLPEEMLNKKEGSPVIFIACELIEHLYTDDEIIDEYYQNAYKADVVIVSTPLYSQEFPNLDFKNPEKQGKLEHIRTFTPREFMKFAIEKFPKIYDWTWQADDTQVMRGIKKGV